MFCLFLNLVLTTGIIVNAWAADGADIEAGRALYLQYGCAVCHGKEGHGDGPAAQRLYARPTDFHITKSYSLGPSSQEMKNVIIRGFKVDNSVMPAFTHIPNHELDQIVAFLLSLQNHEKTQK